MKKYTQLAEVQRYQIEALKKANKEQKEIAVILDVSASTISREIKRNIGLRGYRPRQAHATAMTRRRESAKAAKMTAELVAVIEIKLRLDWSPEQVSGWIGQEKDITLSHERIYQHVWSDKCQGGGFKALISVKNNADQKISEVRSEIELALMIGLRLLNKRHA